METVRNVGAAVLLLAGSVVPADLAGQSRIFAVDSSASIVLPAGFIPAPLNELSVLQFADTVEQTYVIVLLEAKEDLVGWNLQRHSLVTAAQIVATLDLPEVVGPTADQIGATSAIQYEIRGAANGMSIAYLHTSLDSPHAFAQVLAWTVGSQWRDNENLIRDLTASVQVHAAPGSNDYDIRALAEGTWAWDRGTDSCSDLTQRFDIAEDGRSMKIHHSKPIESANGTITSVTDYVVERSSASTLHTYIPGETRLDDNGRPVKWDLVLVGRNRLAWHRTDWPEGSLTGMLRPCPMDTRP